MLWNSLPEDGILKSVCCSCSWLRVMHWHIYTLCCSGWRKQIKIIYACILKNTSFEMPFVDFVHHILPVKTRQILRSLLADVAEFEIKQEQTSESRLFPFFSRVYRKLSWDIAFPSCSWPCFCSTYGRLTMTMMQKRHVHWQCLLKFRFTCKCHLSPRHWYFI